MDETLAAAREAYARCDWHAARNQLTAAAGSHPLAADDAYLLTYAAWWLGDIEESLAAGEEAYRSYLDNDRPEQAAMSAIHVGVQHLLRGDDVLGLGWIRRAERVLADQPSGPAHGYLCYLLEVEAALAGPDLDAVVDHARQVAELGAIHADPNLTVLGLLGEGRALVKQSRTDAGLALLDETMVAVLTEDLRPEWAGNVYCHLMAACHELGDIRRAVAFTDATTRWLETLPAAVLFTGICRVHRSQVLQASGGWRQAEQEAARVCADLEHIHVASAGEAHYQVAELRRLRGDMDAADDAYEAARSRGRDPQPGLALLQLARGQHAAAAAALRTALAGTTDPLVRARLCAAQVDVALATDDVDTAEVAVAELERTATSYGSDGLRASAQACRGALLAARGRPAQALGPLQAASRCWRQLGLPYESARVGLLLARAYTAVGDADSAGRELDAAATVFEQLGAAPDLAAIEAGQGHGSDRGGLTEREVEVLREVAAGHTNRQIATALVISEKTVARHLSNIFVKLGCTSRTAAAAYAFEHGLIPPRRG